MANFQLLTLDNGYYDAVWYIFLQAFSYALSIVSSICSTVSTLSFIGLLQTGVSLNIPANVPGKSTGWKKIQSWQAPIESGHVITGTYLGGTGNSDVHIPLSGMYAVFVTVSFTGADAGGVFKSALIINDKLNNTPNGMVASKKGGPLGPTSLTFQGILYLQTDDFVSVYAYSELDTDWSITDTIRDYLFTSVC